MGTIHAADPWRSRRLQSVIDALTKAGRHGLTTRELINQTGMCAINSIAAELRAAGIPVRCEYERTGEGGGRIYRYRLDTAGG